MAGHYSKKQHGRDTATMGGETNLEQFRTPYRKLRGNVDTLKKYGSREGTESTPSEITLSSKISKEVI
ncbi:MAG TPA: hypothetical protein PLQ76_08655 [bacterium]|nr:hypothetical protein [bacterium]